MPKPSKQDKKPTPKNDKKPQSRRVIEEDLERINEWFDAGLISPESFDRQKADLLKEMENFGK